MNTNKYILFFLILLSSTNIIAQSLDLESVDNILRKIHTDDQLIRKKVMNALSSNSNLQELIAEMDSIDLHNQEYVSNILNVYGWPDNLSEQAHDAIWLVVDHADLKFAEKYFPLIKEKGEKGILKMSDIATLEDRILMKKSIKQKYGTQTIGITHTNEVENIIYIWPIEDNERVDELRASVGLPTMACYLQTFVDQHNIKVIWDKEITIDDLRKKLPMFFSK